MANAKSRAFFLGDCRRKVNLILGYIEKIESKPFDPDILEFDSATGIGEIVHELTAIRHMQDNDIFVRCYTGLHGDFDRRLEKMENILDQADLKGLVVYIVFLLPDLSEVLVGRISYDGNAKIFLASKYSFSGKG